MIHSGLPLNTCSYVCSIEISWGQASIKLLVWSIRRGSWQRIDRLLGEPEPRLSRPFSFHGPNLRSWPWSRLNFVSGPHQNCRRASTWRGKYKQDLYRRMNVPTTALRDSGLNSSNSETSVPLPLPLPLHHGPRWSHGSLQNAVLLKNCLQVSTFVVSCY